MTLLLPLGLLGLISLAVLLLIYLLRPNYQQKLVSSTFVWKLSLKYKKNRMPISRLRNILILILQLLLLACLAVMMAQPAVAIATAPSKNEKVAIIDASAGMMVASDNETRFDRAIASVKELAQSTFQHEDGILSVIIADGDAHFAISRLTAEDPDEIERQLALLGDNTCGYGAADIDGAAKLAQDVLDVNPEAQVILYTGTQYLDQGRFTVVDVSGDDDWNAAVLNVTPVLSESNTYSFTVDAGCYGQAKPMTVTCELIGVNGEANSSPRVATKTEYFTDLEPEKTITFTAADFEGSGEAILSFREMYVHVDEQDTFQRDNAFNVYGGTKQTIRIQYSSSQPNNFFYDLLSSLREIKRNQWNIQIVETSPSNAATEGFDLYVFEHTMPDVTPTDGIVLFADPDKAPTGSGLQLGDIEKTGGSFTLALGEPHPITALMDPARIPTISEYRRVYPSEGYSELLYCNGEPILLAKNEPNAKIVVLAISFSQSDYSVTPDFPIMMYNLFQYYIPATLTSNAFEVGETVKLNARGESLSVDGPDGKHEFTSLPAQIVANMPGDYTVTQTNMAGAPVVEQFFVHIPASESNISKVEDSLPTLYADASQEEGTVDLLIWFASAALLLLVVEWLLHARENL